MSGPEPTPHAELNNFDIRLIVAGTRGFDDYVLFSSFLSDHVAMLMDGDSKIIFLTGKARSGADDMIIRWCKENRFPWSEFQAEWENLEVPGAVIRMRNGRAYNVLAGHQRNAAMARIGTDLIVFWDARSKGTKNMIEEAEKRGLSVKKILIDVEEPRSKTRGKDHAVL